MSAVLAERELVFKVVHLCGGSGFGALGFKRGRAVHGRVSARFQTLFGVDVDPVACADFERIVGAPCYALDLFTREQYTAFHGRPPPEGWVEVTGEMLRALSGGVFPHAVFTSSPCQPFSQLTSNAKAEDPAYSQLTSNAKAEDPAYSQLNELLPHSIELALAAWGDDPPGLFIVENVPRLATRGRALLERAKTLLDVHGYSVAETTHDCGELGGLAQHRQRFLMVARHRRKIRPFLYEPARKPVRGVGEVLSSLPMPDDPKAGGLHATPALRWKTWVRLAVIEAGSDWRSLNKLTVKDGVVQGLRLAPCVDIPDPRCTHRDLGSYQPYGVVGWGSPAPTLTAQTAPGAGHFSVADPRVGGFDGKRTPYNDVWRVIRWDEAAGAITCGATPSAGGQSVADPRVRCKREGEDFSSARHYGVLRWTDASPTVTGSACYDNGAHSVADPRPLPGPETKCTPWIWSLDDTRHRPFTTLEMAALQGYPLDGILDLELGGNDGQRRKHIGNAVPVASAEAIASTFLYTLLLQAAGQSFALSAAPIWVDKQSALALSGVAP